MIRVRSTCPCTTHRRSRRCWARYARRSKSTEEARQSWCSRSSQLRARWSRSTRSWRPSRFRVRAWAGRRRRSTYNWARQWRCQLTLRTPTDYRSYHLNSLWHQSCLEPRSDTKASTIGRRARKRLWSWKRHHRHQSEESLRRGSETGTTCPWVSHHQRKNKTFRVIPNRHLDPRSINHEQIIHYNLSNQLF